MFRRETIYTTSGEPCGHIEAVVQPASHFTSTLESRIIARLIPSVDERLEGTITDVRVVEPERGRGYGPAALKLVVQDLIEMGAALILLQVGHSGGTTDVGRKDAARLVRLYKRQGFEEVIPGGVLGALDDPLLWAEQGEMSWMYLRPH